MRDKIIQKLIQNGHTNIIFHNTIQNYGIIQIIFLLLLVSTLVSCLRFVSESMLHITTLAIDRK